MDNSAKINMYPFSPGGASGKEPACQSRRPKSRGFDPWVGKIPWRRKRQPNPVILPGESNGRRSLVGYSPWGCKESDMTEWLSILTGVFLKVPVPVPSPFNLCLSLLFPCPSFSSLFLLFKSCEFIHPSGITLKAKLTTVRDGQISENWNQISP